MIEENNQIDDEDAEYLIDQALSGEPLKPVEAVNIIPVAPPKPAIKPQVEMSSSMNLHVMELRVRILGGSKVLLAIDRLACPTPGALGAERMRSSMLVLKHWADMLEPAKRSEVMIFISSHAKRAIEIMSMQKKQQDESDE